MINNKNIKSILSISNNKEIIRITDTITEEIVWEKTVTPVEPEYDYMYIQNTYDGQNTIIFSNTWDNISSLIPHSTSVEYSKDGFNFTTLNFVAGGDSTITLEKGEKLYLRNDSGTWNYYDGSSTYYETSIRGSESHIVGGNIKSLVDYTDMTSNLQNPGCFCYLFGGNTTLTDSSNLVMVDDNMVEYTFKSTFYYCTSMTYGPSLPATSVPNYAYQRMFEYCSSLVEIPQISAIDVGKEGMSNMFVDCDSLTSAVLSVKNVGTEGMSYMFSNCDSLTSVVLSIENVENAGMGYMFAGCNSLTSSVLSIENVGTEGMFYMFSNCSSLNSITTNISDISALSCTFHWLDGVASTGTFYNNGSAPYEVDSVSGIPTGWSEVVPTPSTDYFYIENLYNGTNTLTLTSEINFSPHSGSYATSVEYSKDRVRWTTAEIIAYKYSPQSFNITLNKGEKVYFRNTSGFWNHYSTDGRYHTSFKTTRNCGAGGDLRSLLNYTDIENVTLTEGCYAYLFVDCSSLTVPPKLPYTNLAKNCYTGLFSNCSSLTVPPQLPATNLAEGCYAYLFSNCSSLTVPPQLPATNLAKSCYTGLLEYCSSLTVPPQLPATNLAPYCYYGLFWGCSELTVGPELPATNLTEACYTNLFRSCSSLNSVTTYADNIPATSCTEYWLNGVASSGTFRNLGSATYSSGASGIPSGWTVVTE